MSILQNKRGSGILSNSGRAAGAKSALKNPQLTLNLQLLATAKMFVLQQPEPLSFVVEDINGTPFHIRLGTAPEPTSCTCENEHCLHVLFCMIKILKIPSSDPLIEKKALSEDEVFQVLERKQKLVDHQASKYKAAQDKANEENKEEPYPQPLKVQMGEACPICSELVVPSQNLIHCKTGCGRSVHSSCIEKVVNFNLSHSQETSCFHCQASWGMNPLDEIRLAAQKQANRQLQERLEKNKQDRQERDLGDIFSIGFKKFTCRGCLRLITQTETVSRYSCVVCPNVQMCAACFFKGTTHTEHRFLVQPNPSSGWQPANMEGASTKAPKVQMTQERACNEYDRIMQELQTRDITPEDYEILQQIEQLQASQDTSSSNQMSHFLALALSQLGQGGRITKDQACASCKRTTTTKQELEEEKGAPRRVKFEEDTGPGSTNSAMIKLQNCACALHFSCLKKIFEKENNECPKCKAFLLYGYQKIKDPKFDESKIKKSLAPPPRATRPRPEMTAGASPAAGGETISAMPSTEIAPDQITSLHPKGFVPSGLKRVIPRPPPAGSSGPTPSSAPRFKETGGLSVGEASNGFGVAGSSVGFDSQQSKKEMPAAVSPSDQVRIRTRKIPNKTPRVPEQSKNEKPPLQHQPPSPGLPLAGGGGSSSTAARRSLSSKANPFSNSVSSGMGGGPGTGGPFGPVREKTSPTLTSAGRNLLRKSTSISRPDVKDDVKKSLDKKYMNNIMSELPAIASNRLPPKRSSAGFAVSNTKSSQPFSIPQRREIKQHYGLHEGPGPKQPPAKQDSQGRLPSRERRPLSGTRQKLPTMSTSASGAGGSMSAVQTISKGRKLSGQMMTDPPATTSFTRPGLPKPSSLKKGPQRITSASRLKPPVGGPAKKSEIAVVSSSEISGMQSMGIIGAKLNNH